MWQCSGLDTGHSCAVLAFSYSCILFVHDKRPACRASESEDDMLRVARAPKHKLSGEAAPANAMHDAAWTSKQIQALVCAYFDAISCR